MAITRPTGIVSTGNWGNPVTNEVNRLTTESGQNKTNLASIETTLNQLMTPAWKPLPLGASWDWFGSPQQTVNYAKWGNWVWLRGLVKNISGAAITANTTFSTVPSEIGTPTNGLCAVLASTIGSGQSMRITLQANLNYNYLGTTQRSLANGQWFSLEGVSYFLG